MAQECVSIGEMMTLKAGITYALPSRLCRIQSAAAVTVAIDGATFAALTGAETTGAETCASHIKAAADTKVICKAL